MTLLSVYSTVYNSERIVGKSLTSLHKALSPVKDFELVITDDGSTDNTWKILENFAKNHDNVKLLRHKKNRGRGAGRNTALKASKGEFVLSVDLDTLYKLEFGLVIKQILRFYSNNEVLRNNIFTRREVLLKVGGYRNLLRGVDWEIVSRIVIKGFKLKNYSIIPFSLNEPYTGLHREARFAKSMISFGLRYFKAHKDIIRGLNIHPKLFATRLFLRRIKRFSTTAIHSPPIPSLASRILNIVLYPFISLMRFEYVKGMTNQEIVYINEEYVLPEEIGLPKDWFFVVYDNLDTTWWIVKKRIKELKARSFDIKFLLVNNRVLFAFRDWDMVKEYVENYFEGTMPKKLIFFDDIK